MVCSVWHLHLYEKFRNVCDEYSCVIDRRDVKKILYNSHVPIRLHNKLLKEMEEFGLIRLVNKQKVEVIF